MMGKRDRGRAEALAMVFLTLLLRAMALCQASIEYEVVLDNKRIDDVVLDRCDRIITIDNADNLLSIHRTSGVLVHEISLPVEDTARFSHVFSSRKVAVDSNCNIYSLALSMESFVSITKLDSIGRISKRSLPNTHTPKRSDRIIDFNVSNSGRIYLNTVPHGMFRVQDHSVYTFDLEFRYVGNVNYYLEDFQGHAYAIDGFRDGDAILNKYQPVLTQSSDSLRKILSKEVRGSVVVGFDRMNNIYLANGQNLSILDSNFQLVQKIDLPPIPLVGEHPRPRSIRVAYDGTIYVLAQRLKSSENGVRSEKLSSMLLRLK
jgi:hypothetical protein